MKIHNLIRLVAYTHHRKIIRIFNIAVFCSFITLLFNVHFLTASEKGSLGSGDCKTVFPVSITHDSAVVTSSDSLLIEKEPPEPPGPFRMIISANNNENIAIWDTPPVSIGEIMSDLFPLIHHMGGTGAGIIINSITPGLAGSVYIDGIPEIHLSPLGFNAEALPSCAVDNVCLDRLNSELRLKSRYFSSSSASRIQKQMRMLTDIRTSTGSRGLSRFGLNLNNDFGSLFNMSVVAYSEGTKASLEIPGSENRFYRVRLMRDRKGKAPLWFSAEGQRLSGGLEEVPYGRSGLPWDPRGNQKHDRMRFIIGYEAGSKKSNALSVKLWHDALKGKIVQVKDRVDYSASRSGLVMSVKYSGWSIPTLDSRVVLFREDNPYGENPFGIKTQLQAVLLKKKMWNISSQAEVKKLGEYDMTVGGSLGIGLNLSDRGSAFAAVTRSGNSPTFAQRFFGGLVYSDSLVHGTLESSSFFRVESGITGIFYGASYRIGFYYDTFDRGVLPVYSDKRVIFTSVNDWTEQCFSGFASRKLWHGFSIDGQARILETSFPYESNAIPVFPQLYTGANLFWRGAFFKNERLKLYGRSGLKYLRPSNDLPHDLETEDGIFLDLTFGFRVIDFSFQYNIFNLAGEDYRTLGVFSREPYSYSWEIRWLWWD